MPVERSPQQPLSSSSKYKVTCSEKFGRYLVATKSIAPGEMILRENPTAVGPTTFNKEYICFSCMRSLSKIEKEALYICSRCQIAPLCSIACERKFGHHTPDECEAFRNNRYLSKNHIADIIGILLPLRLYFLKRKNSDTWEKIESMQSHLEKRRNTAVWIDRQINVVKVIRSFRLTAEQEISSPDEFLQHLCGILDVNTFELRSPGGLDGVLLRGLYTEAALMAHDCRGNTHLAVDDKFQLTVYASVTIEKDEAILFNYTSSLLGTTDRREHLREGKYFECDCSVCKDPCEKGSHLSTFLCPHCKKGFVVMQNPLDTNPNDRKTVWKCLSCAKCYSSRLMRATLNITRNMIDQVDDSNIQALEVLVTKLSTSFHPNHFLMIALKQKLLAAYRKEVASLNPQKKVIQKMLDLCKQVYDVLDTVEPGISRLKGILLYEMHLPMAILANRAYSSGEISSKELASRLEEAEQLLRKALKMLLLEPKTTPEGQLAKRALQELKILNQNINDVKLLPPEESPKRNGRKMKDNKKK